MSTHMKGIAMTDDIMRAAEGKYLPLVVVFVTEDGDLEVVASADAARWLEDPDTADTFATEITDYLSSMGKEYLKSAYNRYIKGEPI